MERGEEPGRAAAAQRPASLSAEGQGLVRAPHRQEARVDDEVPRFASVHEGSRAEPVEDVVAVVGGEHFVERVPPARARETEQAGDEVQVVVAEYHLDGRAALHRPAQHAEGVGAPVHEIADEHDAIGPLAEADAAQQLAKRSEAALHVPDDPGRHDVERRTADRGRQAGCGEPRGTPSAAAGRARRLGRGAPP